VVVAVRSAFRLPNSAFERVSPQVCHPERVPMHRDESNGSRRCRCCSFRIPPSNGPRRCCGAPRGSLPDPQRLCRRAAEVLPQRRFPRAVRHGCTLATRRKPVAGERPPRPCSPGGAFESQSPLILQRYFAFLSAWWPSQATRNKHKLRSRRPGKAAARNVAS